MESVRFALFTKNKKSPKVMSLPPTSKNVFLHVLRAHLQVMLWKAAEWEIRDGVPTPVAAQGDPAPKELNTVMQCQSRARDTMCSTEIC